MTTLPDPMPKRPAPTMPAAEHDVLSDLLRAVRLSGAMLFLVEAHAPWRTAAPHARVFAPAVLPRARHLVSYHVVTAGSCCGGLVGEEPQRLEPGDVLVVPHGDPYYLAAPADVTPEGSDRDALAFFQRMAEGTLPPVVKEGQHGEATEFICGFLGCEARPFNPILTVLPRVLHVRGATAAGNRLAQLVAAAQDELRAPAPGSREVVLRLCELMFVEVVRHHCRLGGETAATGWLAGLRDPLVGAALARLHARPASAWTLAALAAEVHSSRSTLAERFTQVVGQPPMQYLAAWRLQLAARLLADERQNHKVMAVAQQVGYGSEAAFSRAFKKATGVAPSQWRPR